MTQVNLDNAGVPKSADTAARPREQREIQVSDLREGRVRDDAAGRVVFWRGERPESD